MFFSGGRAKVGSEEGEKRWANLQGLKGGRQPSSGEPNNPSTNLTFQIQRSIHHGHGGLIRRTHHRFLILQGIHAKNLWLQQHI